MTGSTICNHKSVVVPLRYFHKRKLREANPKKKSASVWNFSKGGEGGHFWIQTFQGTFLFCSCLEIFQKGGGFPNSKLFEEVFCFCLENFQEEGGGVTLFQNFWGTFLLEFGHFSGRRGWVAWFQRWWGTFSALAWTFSKVNGGGWPKSKHF